jgi:hypothetical protein
MEPVVLPCCCLGCFCCCLMSWPPSWFLHTVGLVLRWVLRCCVTVSYSWVTAVSNMLRFDFDFEVLGVWIFLGKMTTSCWLLGV